MKTINYWLVAILIIASVFRLPYLSSHMPSLYGDEIALGYNAFSIATTGRDEFGRFMPLQFESWGDQKNPVYIYATAIIQLFTGASATSVRLPSAIAGICAVYLTYRLVLLLKLPSAVALLSSLLLALTPWHIHISRGGYEANVALTLGLASVVALLSKKLYWSALYLALAAYTYYTTKLFAPAMLALVWLWQSWGTPIKSYASSLLRYWGLVVLLGLPALYLAFFAGGQVRYQNINIFVDKTIVPRVERGRNFYNNSKSLLAKITENKFTYNLQDFATYYFDNFSGQFLFVGGDSNNRYGMVNHGMLYLLDAPLLIMGLVLLYTKHRRAWILLVAWLLLAPLPTALVGRAYGLRSIAMLPIPQIFAAYSLYQFYLWSKLSKWRSLLFAVCCMLYAISVSNFLLRYIYQYPSYGRYWYDSTMFEALQHAKQNEDKYDNIIITQHYGETSMYYAFYNQIDPRVYRDAKDNRLTVDGVPMIKIGKYYFGDIRPKGPIEQMDLPHNTLLIVQPLFEYGEGALTARDDGRVIFRTFGFPTVHMKAINSGK